MTPSRPPPAWLRPWREVADLYRAQLAERVYLERLLRAAGFSVRPKGQ